MPDYILVISCLVLIENKINLSIYIPIDICPNLFWQFNAQMIYSVIGIK